MESRGCNHRNARFPNRLNPEPSPLFSPSRHRRDACPTRNSQAEQPSYASFYRETKITKDEWLAKLKQVRSTNKILASDECAWITGGASGTTCSEHFGFDV